jgi:hypothetical protein
VRERVEVSSEAGVVVVADSRTTPPAGLDQDALLQRLEPMARSGDAFFLVTDDPVRFRIDLVSGEPPRPDADPAFEALGGVFRLEVPSGQVAVTGWDKSGTPTGAGVVALARGTQQLSVLTRRPFDGARHVKEMRELLGAEWAYMERVNKLGLVGCLPMLVTAIAVFARKWDWLWFLVPVLVLAWLPYFALKSGSRYRAAERRSLEHDRARPHYVITLAPTAESGLPGGFLRV